MSHRDDGSWYPNKPIVVNQLSVYCYTLYCMIALAFSTISSAIPLDLYLLRITRPGCKTDTCKLDKLSIYYNFHNGVHAIYN